MTMHLVNFSNFSKSIFEFIFVPVITGLFSQNSREGHPPPKGGGGGGAVKYPKSSYHGLRP